MLEPQTLRFFSKLKKNNNKEWFDNHRTEYEASRIDFSNFIQLVIDELQKTDASIAGMSSKETLFRINRDIRFSKDKTPYKSNMGASIKKGGKKSRFGGYYFHFEPGGNSFVGGGVWMPEAAELKKIRQEIDYNWDEFKTIINNKDFKKVFGDVYKADDVSLSTMPKGYDKQHPAADYLKLKSLIAETRLSDEELISKSLHRKTINSFKALKPLLDFLNRALETED